MRVTGGKKGVEKNNGLGFKCPKQKKPRQLVGHTHQLLKRNEYEKKKKQEHCKMAHRLAFLSTPPLCIVTFLNIRWCTCKQTPILTMLSQVLAWSLGA